MKDIDMKYLVEKSYLRVKSLLKQRDIVSGILKKEKVHVEILNFTSGNYNREINKIESAVNKLERARDALERLI